MTELTHNAPLRIGDKAPDFSAETTHGPLKFSERAPVAAQESLIHLMMLKARAGPIWIDIGSISVVEMCFTLRGSCPTAPCIKLPLAWPPSTELM